MEEIKKLVGTRDWRKDMDDFAKRAADMAAQIDAINRKIDAIESSFGAGGAAIAKEIVAPSPETRAAVYAALGVPAEYLDKDGRLILTEQMEDARDREALRLTPRRRRAY